MRTFEIRHEQLLVQANYNDLFREFADYLEEMTALGWNFDTFTLDIGGISITATFTREVEAEVAE